MRESRQMHIQSSADFPSSIKFLSLHCDQGICLLFAPIQPHALFPTLTYLCSSSETATNSSTARWDSNEYWSWQGYYFVLRMLKHLEKLSQFQCLFIWYGITVPEAIPHSAINPVWQGCSAVHADSICMKGRTEDQTTHKLTPGLKLRIIFLMKQKRVGKSWHFL